MAESPGDDSDEFLFLDKEFLDMLTYKPPKPEFQSALQEISERLSEQKEKNESTKTQYKNLKEKIKAASKENENLRKDIENIKEQIQLKEKELEKLNSCESKDLYRYECMLYHTISKIKWDLECPENEIAGIGGKTISTFQLDSNKHSKTFITDHLWNLIGNTGSLNKLQERGLRKFRH